MLKNKFSSIIGMEKQIKVTDLQKIGNRGERSEYDSQLP